MRSLIVIAALLAAAPAFAGGRQAPSQHQRDSATSARPSHSARAPVSNRGNRGAPAARGHQGTRGVPAARGHQGTRGVPAARGHHNTRQTARQPVRQTQYRSAPPARRGHAANYRINVQHRHSYGQRRTVQRADPWNRAWRPAPRRDMTWVGGRHTQRGWEPGFWRPTFQRANMVWVAGYWDGGFWVDGYWRSNHRAGFIWVDGYYSGHQYVRGTWRQSRARRVIYR